MKDPELGIYWPLKTLVLSEKGLLLPTLDEIHSGIAQKQAVKGIGLPSCLSTGLLASILLYELGSGQARASLCQEPWWPAESSRSNLRSALVRCCTSARQSRARQRYADCKHPWRFAR